MMGRNRKHSPEQVQEIILLHHEGFLHCELARRFDCGERTIQLILWENGLSGVAESKKFSDVEEETIARLYCEGFLQRELAELFQCAVSTIREALRQQNVTMRRSIPGYVPTPEQIEEATRKIRAGWNESTRHEREDQRGYVRVPRIIQLTRPRAGHTPSSV